MNLFERRATRTHCLVASSGLLGATGLSRTALRGVFAEIGLFGRDTPLSAREQAAVYAELRLPAGAVPVIAWKETAADAATALRVFAREVLVQRGVVSAEAWTQASLSGLDERVLRETLRAVRHAVLLYGTGPSSSDVRVDQVRVDSMALPACA